MMKYWMFLVVLSSLFIGNKVQGGEPPKEIPKEWSLSPMLSAVKFQKQDGQKFEILPSGGGSINYCPNPTSDICVIFHPAGFSLRIIPDDWGFSWLTGVTLIDKRSKWGIGIGVSCDLFGHREGNDIGMAEGFSSNNFGLLLLLYQIPSQSSYEASKIFVEKGQEAEKRVKQLAEKGQKSESKREFLRAFELYLKARKVNPQNDEAQKGIRRILEESEDINLFIKATKEALKIKDQSEVKELLDRTKEQNPTPQQLKEIENLEEKIRKEINP